MTFEIADLTAYAVAFLVLAAVTTLVAAGFAAEFLTRNRKVRVARHQSIPTYYRTLLAS